MSHVTLREPKNMNEIIDNLSALQRATERLGGQFLAGKRSFVSYGKSESKVNGMPCVHALAPTGKVGEYQVGVLDAGNGQYKLACDFFMGGVAKAFGEGLNDLTMHYQMETARDKAMLNGDLFSEQKLDDGSYEVRIDTTARLGY